MMASWMSEGGGIFNRSFQSLAGRSSNPTAASGGVTALILVGYGAFKF